MCSIQISERSSPSATLFARSMLPEGLWPVLEIERLPRVCFVLRVLLGYATDLCAQIVGIEESAIRILVQTAAVQLQQKSVASSA